MLTYNLQVNRPTPTYYTELAKSVLHTLHVTLQRYTFTHFTRYYQCAFCYKFHLYQLEALEAEVSLTFEFFFY